MTTQPTSRLPTRLLLAAAAALALPAAALAASLPGPAFPLHKSAAALGSACDRQIADAAQRVQRLERQAPGPKWLAAYDDLNAFIEDGAYPSDLLANVHPEQALRDAAQACTLKWSEFTSTLGQNEKLYRAAKAVAPRDAIDREYLRLILEGFEDTGVSLPPDRRTRAKQILDRTSDLNQQFDKNVRDDRTQVAFTEAELQGVPPEVWKDAPRDAQGRITLKLDYPSYLPVIQFAQDPAARERMWRAKTNEGGEENLKLLGEIATLRHEYAQLFGVSSYADFVLRRRMAGSDEKVQAFLDGVKAAVTERERRDLAELRDAKAQHLGAAAAEAPALSRWDAAFYTERLRRQRYSVDQEAFREYFPPQQSLQFAMRVIEKIMGVRYTRVKAKTWHPEVQSYAISDAASGKPLAALHVDLFPRDGKYNHAAVWSYRGGATRNHRLPQAALVVNFNRRGLTLDEMETLLHELGHAVHTDLSMTRYNGTAGTNTTRDFVEAPSQMLEEWVYDPQVLKVFAEVCPSCKPVPAELIGQAVKARDFGKGIQVGRQLLYAGFDLALHGRTVAEPLALWERMEGATPLGYVPGTRFPAGFTHVAGGYAAGYYGYMWSLVIAKDLETAFGSNKLDAKVGQRYRRVVLGNGAQRPAAELVEEFLGRPGNSKAFFDYLAR